MVPILLSRSEIDDTRWDQAITCSKQHVMYALTWYLDLLCEDWNAIVWPSEADYQVVLPLPLKRKWGVEVVYQPIFCQYLGFFCQHDLCEEVICDFLALMDFRFRYISGYNFNPHNTGCTTELLRKFTVTSFSTNWLSLDRPYEVIAEKYSSDRQTNLKRSKRRKWTVHQSDDISTLIRLFRENHEFRIRGGVARDAYLKLERLYRTIDRQARATLLYASEGDGCDAGILVVRSGETAIYLFNAATSVGRSGNARTFLLDHYFRSNAGQNLLFDFECPPIKSISSYYGSFGSETKAFICIQKNKLPFPFNILQRWRRAFFKTKQSLF